MNDDTRGAAAKNDLRRHGRELYVPRLPTSERTFDLRGRLTARRSDPGDVARILRRWLAAAGVFSDATGHSLRRGFIANAGTKKFPIENIKRVTGQRSNAIVLEYVTAATLDDEPPLLEIVG